MAPVDPTGGKPPDEEPTALGPPPGLTGALDQTVPLGGGTTIGAGVTLDAGTRLEQDVTRAVRGTPTGSGPFEIGQQLGTRYTIIKLLGVGGMGAVYQAWDAELNVAVAIKTILPDRARDPRVARDLERRFKSELLLARQVTHKNVVRIHDLGEIGGVKYITMPFLQGETLGARMKTHGAVSIAEILDYARQMTEGLAAAHEAGIVHRDLKPDNIMITPEGQVLIMDFGIASSASGGTPGDGAIVGTPLYMAPEQATPTPVDQRADIYAVGLMMYDALTNRRRLGLSDSALEDLKARSAAAPEDLRTVVSEVPEPLNAVVMRCLQPDRSARYADAAELLAALNELTPEGHRKPNRQRMAWMAASAAGVVLLGLTTWLWFRPAGPAAAPEPLSVLVADFTNATGEPVFNGLVEQALATNLEAASFINNYSRAGDTIRQAVAQTQGRALTVDNAKLISLREGINVVVSGTIAKAGSGYRLGVQAIAPGSGEVPDRLLVDWNTSARNRDEVLAAVGRLAARVRNRLGDRSASESRLSDNETFTAKSLEAAGAYMRGQDLQFAGKYEAALEEYARAVALDPDMGRAYAGLGAVSSSLGRMEDAEEYYNNALTRLDRMTEREKYRTRGGYFLMMRKPDQAREVLAELVGKFPADSAGLTNLAFAYFQHRDFASAMKIGRQAADVQPKSVLQRNNLALYAMYAGQFDVAEAEARKVLAINKDFTKAHVAIALAQLGRGRPGDARATFEGLRRVPSTGPVYAAYGLSDLDMYQGRLADAASTLTSAAADPANAAARPRLLVRLAHVRSAQGRRAEALRLAGQAGSTSRSTSVRFLAAQLQAENGQGANALAVAGEFKQRLDADSQALGWLLEGEVDLVTKDPRAALAKFSQALKLADSWLVRHALGRAYLALDSFVEADGEFDRCLSRLGEATAVFLDDVPSFHVVAPAYYYQAVARAALGNQNGAAQSFKTFLAISADADENSGLIPAAQRQLAALRR